jgi:hypothetical protein
MHSNPWPFRFKALLIHKTRQPAHLGGMAQETDELYVLNLFVQLLEDTHALTFCKFISQL